MDPSKFAFLIQNYDLQFRELPGAVHESVTHHETTSQGILHAVTTEIKRSMSRSVLYRCGETRMLPCRRLVMTPALRSVS